MLSLADAEVFSESWLRWVALDGDDEPDWEKGCARWYWQLEPDERRGVLVYDLPSRALRSGWTWTRHGEAYAQPAIVLRGGEKGRARHLAGCHELGHVVSAVHGLVIDGSEERWANRFAVSLLAPAHVVRRAWGDEGLNLGRVQRHMPRLFATAATLRLGELDLARVLVIERGRTRYAVGGELPAREATRLVRFAANDLRGRADGDGMRAYRLPDGFDRFAVLRAA